MYRVIGAFIIFALSLVPCAPILSAAEEPSGGNPAASLTETAEIPAATAGENGGETSATKDGAPAPGLKKRLPNFVDESGKIQWKRASDVKAAEQPKEERSLLSVIFSIIIWGAVVVLLIIGGFFLFKKFVPGSKHLFGSKLMRILGRTNLSPKHSVYLLKVGDRVIVIGVCGEEIRPLSEITDPREVAFLTSEGAPAAPAERPFGGLFKRSRNSYAPKPEDKETLGEAKEEIERIRMMVSSWKERYQGAQDPGKESVS